VKADAAGYVVQTDQGTWRAKSVVLAAGACSIPVLPAFVDQVPVGITSLTRTNTATRGACTGRRSRGRRVGHRIQIAEELHRSGRPVTVATGEHVRLPARIAGGTSSGGWTPRACWMRLHRDRRPATGSELPSMQLVGAPGRTIDLNALQALGVRLIGRLAGIRDGVAQFSGSLPNVCALADLKMIRLLDSIDIWAASASLDDSAVHRSPRRACKIRCPCRSTCARARSRRSSGRRIPAGPCPGSTSRYSTASNGSTTTAE